MNIAFDITHPSDVHQFKNCITTLRQQGNGIKVTARDLNSITQLLQQNGIEYVIRKSSSGLVNRIKNIFPIVSQLYKNFKPFHPDLLIGGSGNLYIPQVGKLFGKPSVVFDDTEHSRIQNLLTFPFASYICTPACYSLDIGKKQIRYQGSKELAYLHPNNYHYDEIKFKIELFSYLRHQKNWHLLKKLQNDNKVILLRLVAWKATHDLFRQRSIDWQGVISELQQMATVIIVAENINNSSNINFSLPADKFHDLISFADLVISEGATTAAEAAVLGKPAIYCNKLRVGYVDEYDQKYGLIQQKTNEIDLLQQVKIYLSKHNLKNEFNTKRQNLLRDKIDVNQWMLDFISKLNSSSSKLRNPKRNIYFVSNFDPRYTRAGGIETYVKEISHSLIEDSYKINIIGVSEESKSQRRNLRSPFQEKLNNTNRMKFSKHLPVFFNKKSTLSTSFDFLFHLLIKGPFLNFNMGDILHIQRPDFALPFIFKKNKKICSVHGHPGELIEYRKKRWIYHIYNLIERITLPFLDKIVFVDYCTMSKYQQRYPHYIDKMTIVPCCVNNQFYPFSEKEINKIKSQFGIKINEAILLLVVRLEKEKKIFDIIKIFNSLAIHRQLYKRARLLIVGNGILFDKVRKEIKQVSNDHIILLNHIKHEKLPQIYNIADATILLSHTEGMPMVALESLACGTPLLGNRVGDLPRLIKNEFNGYLVDNESVHEKLNLLLENPPKWTENCVTSISLYRIDNFIHQIKQLYEEVN